MIQLSVRASVGNYLVGKYISEHSDCKVIFNGDGSDEVMGGYMYFHKAPNAIDFDNECKRLISNIHYFDGLRSDRCISCHGLEPRTPFLDYQFVKHFLSIDRKLRFNTTIENVKNIYYENRFNDATRTYCQIVFYGEQKKRLVMV